MGNLVCDWLSLTDAHIQRVEPQRGAAQQQDTCAAHFLRVSRPTRWSPPPLHLHFECSSTTMDHPCIASKCSNTPHNLAP